MLLTLSTFANKIKKRLVQNVFAHFMTLLHTLWYCCKLYDIIAHFMILLHTLWYCRTLYDIVAHFTTLSVCSTHLNILFFFHTQLNQSAMSTFDISPIQLCPYRWVIQCLGQIPIIYTNKCIDNLYSHNSCG